MWSWLENMMKSKLMKKITTYQYKNLKMCSRAEKKSEPGSVTKFPT